MDHTCTRKLFCELTADELLARGNELVTELTGITKLEYARSRVNAKIKPKKERVDELAVIIEQKKEERDVKCEWFHDWQGGKKTLRRLDTYEELETDIIREWERQQHLKFTEEIAPGGYGVEDEELTATDEEARRVGEKSPVSLCATCLGDCCLDNPCASMSKCTGYSAEPLPAEVKRRDDTCSEWRECGHTFKCFGPANEEDGICFKSLEDAKEFEEEQGAAAEPEYVNELMVSDPLANEHGVYANAEEITIPIPAKARATASIHVIQCSDGFWRSNQNYLLRDCGGWGGLPSVKSMGHCTRYDAMLEALDRVVMGFEGFANSPAGSRAKIAIEAVEKFRAELPTGPTGVSIQ